MSDDRSPKPLRVLVVDDNVDSSEMMVVLLEAWGHEAFRAGDGQEALTMARDLRPAVVLLDIGLPGMDGFEVARSLRADALTSGARIIAVSGFGDEASRERAIAAGCDELIVKPVDVARLERALVA